MIGQQPAGTIRASSLQPCGLRVSVDGKPRRLAVVLDDGTVVSAGDDVAREAEAVAVNCYRRQGLYESAQCPFAALSQAVLS